MERYTYKLISLERINPQNPYCLRASLEDECLLKSIEKHGVMMPVIVTQGPQTALIDGHRRLHALRQLGRKEFPALQLLEIHPAPDQFMLAVMANGRQTMPDLDRALTLRKASEQFQIRHEKIIEEFLPLLGLPQQRYVLEDYLAVSKLECQILALIASGKAPFRGASALQRFNLDDQKSWVRILSQASFTTNELRHLCEWTGDLLKLKGAAMEDFLDAQNLNGILNHAEWDGRCKAKQYYKAMKTIRFPRIAEYERKFKTLAREIDGHTSAGVKIEESHSFEEEGFTVRARLRNPESLDQLLDLLKQKKSSLNSLFDSRL
ncbi:MAG TPA: ParB/RepB/Spo0J family partition protein [bacterium]|nr:ParB/RepB/Spo0J family partition protein [bacterium]